MIESYFILKNKSLVESRWREKNLLSSEILKEGAWRQLRPEVVGDRSRLDLMWFENKLGLRSKRPDPESPFEFFEMTQPDTVQPPILEMIEAFIRVSPPVKMAQIRFRCGVKNKRGLWIDCSNEDIQALLKEKKSLARLLDFGWVIEMGQKHKILNPELRLAEAQSHAWLPSFNPENEEIPLESYVSLFSQPGPEVNRALISAGLDLLDEAHVSQESSWMEWGAGYGNLTAAFAPRLGLPGLSTEMDPAATRLLGENAKKFFPKLTVKCLSADSSLKSPEATSEVWILDPPRTGFTKLLRTLTPIQSPARWILLYHCHNSGLISDSTELKNAGYKLFRWSSVDAFPATTHHEVISLWEYKK